MIYCFKCISPDHPKTEPAEFERVFHGIPAGKVITQCDCSCGAVAKRDLSKEIPTQAVVGLTPISHSTTGKGSLQSEVGFAFGRFGKNPDGSTDKNHTRFRDSGELDRYMKGQNELGDPVLNDKGEPVKRADGTIVRQGAKLFKYSANSAPSQDGLNRRRINPKKAGVRWVGERAADGYGGNIGGHNLRKNIYKV